MALILHPTELFNESLAMSKRRDKRKSNLVTSDNATTSSRARSDYKVIKAESKTSKIQAKADLALAKGQKRKWLFFLIVAGIAAYMILSSGAGTTILTKLKGLF